MGAEASDYKWSSARVRCGLAYDSLLDQTWPPAGLIPDWAEWLAGEDDEAREKSIRRNTSVGRPCGDQSFIERIEQQTHRTLRPKRRGRKPEPRIEGSRLLWPEEGKKD
jgi:putative transposase